MRDRVVDYVRYWRERAEIAAQRILRWIGVPEGTFYNWKQRYGKVNEHNGWIPRDHWLEEWEKGAILKFYWEHPLDGYRRLTYKMLDADIRSGQCIECLPCTQAGRRSRPTQHQNRRRRAKVFNQPNGPHKHCTSTSAT